MADDINGSSVAMTAGRNVARVLATALAMVAALVVGFSANAMAAAPVVAIGQPLTGSSIDSQTPAFSGTSSYALTAVTLKIYAGASAGETPIQTLTDMAPVEVAPGEATWEVTPEAALEQGEYTAVAEQLNSESELGTSPPVTFTVDVTKPAVSMNAVASPTEDPRPVLSGGAGVEVGDEATVGVVIFAGTGVGGTKVAEEVVAVTEGAWSYKSPLLANGTYTAQAYQLDEAGNVGASSAETFTVETKPPVVTMNTLAAITNDPKPTLTGTGGVAVSDEADVTVWIHKGTSISGSVVAAESVQLTNGEWSYTPTAALPDGTYTAQASQSNESHEVGASSPQTFTVDTTPPAVTIETPNTPVVHLTRPKFSGRAGVAPGDDHLVKLKIAMDGSGAGISIEESLTPNGAGEWSISSIGLTDGVYTAVVEQADDAGNVGKSAVTFAIETNSPKVTLNKAGFVRRGVQLVTGAAPSFSGTGSSEPEDSRAVVVEVYRGATTSSAPVQAVEGLLTGSEWTSSQVQALPDGTYTAQAEQADTSHGSQTGVSEAVTFTVDADAPQPAITSPANGSTSTGETQVVSGTAGTQAGDLPGVTVRLYAGSTATGAPLQSNTAQASGASWSAAFAGLSPGTYTAQAQQSDDVGNVGSSEPVTFSVTVAETPPVSTPVAPSASFKSIPAAPLAGEAVTLVSTSSDSSSPITSYAWAPSGNGVFVPGEATLATTFATPGPHVVQLQVTDAAGQSSVVAETIAVSSAPVSLMQPFPVVRMAGSYDSTGAKISVLSALVPVGAKVAITCRGRHCPAKSLAFLATAGAKSKSGTVLITFRRFERALHAGTVIEIWVSKPGEIGKFTRFTIHRGKSPSRVDECLNPAGTTPLVCPS